MDKYYIYKKVFFRDMADDDINFIIDKCNKDDEDIIKNIVKTNKYVTEKNMKIKVGYSSMKKIMEEIDKQKYRKISYEYLDDLKKICYFDDVQLSVLDKMIELKKINEQYINIDYDAPIESKKCPHCGTINTAPIGTTYIVCGVDMQGKKSINELNLIETCRNDWCFVCGKKLCKNWYNDELYIKKNRIHNDKCCEKHAEQHGFKYPDDYCQCSKGEFMIV
jgi:hypothetical protein